MCGIVAGVAGRDVVPVLLEGLRRLEYRGYDSCGVAVVREGRIERARSTARVKDLAAQVAENYALRTAVRQSARKTRAVLV